MGRTLLIDTTLLRFFSPFELSELIYHLHTMQLTNMTHIALLLHIGVQLVNSEIPKNDLHIQEKFLILIKFGK